MTEDETAVRVDNIVAAIPTYPAKPLSTVEIWHAARRPKLSFGAMRNFLRTWSESNDGLERIGGAMGAQHYRLEADYVDTVTEAVRKRCGNLRGNG